jgi:beta-N-acetylhexosaminidase
MRELSIDRCVAQLFMVGFSGAEAGVELLPIMESHGFTSFILFERNVESGEDLRRMISEARDRGRNLRLPELCFAADEEGGLISPLGTVAGRLPSAMALAAGQNEERARLAAQAVALGLKNIGLDLVLAPVMDANDEPSNPVIGTRSYGDDPELVASMGTAVLEGYRSAGLACCVKHFPGHGSTTEDSHKCLPVVEATAGQLQLKELPPFVAAFARGAEAAMTAHVAYPLVDGESSRPATLSPEILTDLLREKLEFEGTVLSDSMEMMGLSGHMPAPEACVEALKAGVDMFICVDSALAVECARRVRRAYERGDLRDVTVTRALGNVERLKAASPQEPPESPEGASEGAHGDRENILDECYAASVTLLGSESQALKEIVRAAKKGVLLLPEGLPRYEKTDVSFAERMISGFGLSSRWRVLPYPFDPGGADIGRVVDQVDPTAQVIFSGLSRGPVPRGQRVIFETLLAGRRVLAAATLLDPYEAVRGFPKDLPRIAAYGYWPECLAALFNSVFGGAYPSGALPVRVP